MGLLSNPNFLRKGFKQAFFFITLALILVFAGTVLLEGGLRVFWWLKNKQQNPAAIYHDILGWQPVPFQSQVSFYPGYGEVEFTSQDYGFRLFGDPATEKIKILIIGDSFTQAEMISDGKVYYHSFPKTDPNVELFAFGANGYGTLQEYMILDRYIDKINPDLILWQFCNNDLVNNSFALESSSYLHNNEMLRPYYHPATDSVELLYPQQYSRWADRLTRWSYLCKVLKIDQNIRLAEKFGSIEERLTSHDSLFIDAVKITGAIMAKVRKRAAGTPVVAFAVITDDFPAVDDSIFSRIALAQGMYYIDGINQALASAKKEGISIDGFKEGGDEHWNEYSHAVAGKMIYDFLKANDLLKKKR